jgi:cell shape-determining protein MreC
MSITRNTYVMDEDGLVGRVLRVAFGEVTVVRLGDCDTLERFSYADSQLSVCNPATLDDIQSEYIDALRDYNDA